MTAQQRAAIPTRSPARLLLVVLAAAAAIAVLACLEMSFGAIHIPFSAIIHCVFTGHSGRESWDRIVLVARLPRLLNALAAGGALGICGVLLQTLLRNPLADPYVLGTVHGARLGVAVLMSVLGAGSAIYTSTTGVAGYLSVAAAAAAGCALVTLLLVIVARHTSGTTLLIFGLMLGFLCIGLITTVLHFVDDSQQAVFRFWDHGGFSGATLPQLRVMYPLLAAGALLAFSQVKPLNVLVLGDAYAASMGVAAERTRRIGFGATALLAGVVTAFCGPVAFLGLVAAQLARVFVATGDHRRLLPVAALLGSTLALLCDFLIHLPWKGEPLPLDVMLGLVGAPVVMWFLLRDRAMRRLEL